ncbi:NADP oxidoreductase [Pseudoroseomonas wenyumeiae]|uniref:NADP oxidoreductase n=1 Tax=Teichococcus wenyumeiae TaxID=2478470 RepID=A0A3A9JLR5_9PROT|nr:NADP oxidoreductase [Pseudoroseomonas wenyumeiae]RMI25976.1 NADP oxidoreductase [Pseudoroseomonas wenyumeiae]
MRIGIIGAGHIGQATARLAIAAGHEVMLSNSRGPETLVEVAAQTGARTGTVEEAAAFGELVVVAVPLHQYRAVPAAPLAGKVVLDANNYYPDRDGRIPELDARTETTTGLLARHLPQARVVKALNAILVAHLAPSGTTLPSGHRRALPIAGNDAAAKAVVATLLGQFGFDAVDAGPISESWRFERAKPAYCIPLDREGLTRALAAAERDKDLPEGSWKR